MESWRAWLPVALCVAGIAAAMSLADKGRQSGALILLGFSMACAGVALGVWLRERADGKDDNDGPPVE